MKALLQAGPSGRVPAPPEKLFLISLIATGLLFLGCARLDAGERLPLKVPTGFRVLTNTVAEASAGAGWAKMVVHEATGIEFAHVPPGEFTMGSPADEEWRRPDEAQHRVRIEKGFYLGRYEVTQAQWNQVMGSNPSAFANNGDRAPVEQVSWDDCREFIARLNAGSVSRGGSGTVSNAGPFRLPVEAEWEYACRAGSTGPFHYRSPMNHTMGNFDGYFPYKGQPKGLFRKKTMEVGSFEPNAWGLYDMHGNVSEWCADLVDATAVAGAPCLMGGEGGGPPAPGEPSFGPLRVCRGGSWFDDVWACRAPTRAGREPANRYYDLGLRLAFSCE